MIDMPTFFISACLGGLFGGAVVALFRVTRKPEWIKEVVKSETHRVFAPLHQRIEDQQNKVGQAYQVFGWWANHFARGTTPGDGQIDEVMDYFGTDPAYNKDFLSAVKWIEKP